MNILRTAIAHSEARASLFSRMTASLGIDIVAASAANDVGVGSAMRRCLSCAASQQCERYLDSAGHGSDAPTFCSNRTAFRSMSRQT